MSIREFAAELKGYGTGLGVAMCGVTATAALTSAAHAVSTPDIAATAAPQLFELAATSIATGVQIGNSAYENSPSNTPRPSQP